MFLELFSVISVEGLPNRNCLGLIWSFLCVMVLLTHGLTSFVQQRMNAALRFLGWSSRMKGPGDITWTLSRPPPLLFGDALSDRPQDN